MIKAKAAGLSCAFAFPYSTGREDRSMGMSEGQRVTCPLCGAPMALRETTKFRYRNGQPRKFYGCSRWPACSATHGAHPDGRPLGVPGDEETKRKRMEAHELFDRLWKFGRYTRKAAYRIMGERMGLRELHIGELDSKGCDKLMELLKDEGE